MEARKLSFFDIEAAIQQENVNISGGDIKIGKHRRSLRVSSEFSSMEQIRNIVVKAEEQKMIYLKDVAEVKDTYVERQSYARMITGDLDQESKPVVSVRVIKKSGENLILASKKVQKVVDEAKEGYFPKDLNIVFTENQATNMEAQLANLENSIISGVILVVLVLLFFMGLRNAVFVGVAIPLSMFMAFLILSMANITINVVVLFALILALGMLVDNAIVVIENIYRLREQGLNNATASKQGIGEVAMPIIGSTLTTLAAFVPLAFWGGIMGEFMKYLPITLITVLASSLFVGLIFNPVLARQFMKLDEKEAQNKKFFIYTSIVLTVISVPLYFTSENFTTPNVLLSIALLTLGNIFVFKPASEWFRNVFLLRLENIYRATIETSLRYSFLVFISAIVILVLSVVVFQMSLPAVTLFPDSDPDYVYLYVEAPLGTDVSETNEQTLDLERKVYNVLKPYEGIIDAIVVNVGENTSDPNEAMFAGGDRATPHKSRITVNFVPFDERDTLLASDALRDLAFLNNEIPNLKIKANKNENGPPVGKPVSIEIIGPDYATLIEQSEKIRSLIENENVAGLEGLDMDLEIGKPELLVNIRREEARRFGLSTSQIGMIMRTAIYGKEVSKFKDGEDDYPIQLRLQDKLRYDISALKNQKMIFQDKKGRFHQVPLSSVLDMQYGSTYGSVKRKDLDRAITLSSNVIEGYNANRIVAFLKALLKDYEMPRGYSFKFTGEQEEQQESTAFLANALLVALAAIFLILVSQFNSVFKPIIIVVSVIFSLIGVFLGMTVFGDDFVIIMTGVGIISLAGVVVNNAIVLIDYTDLLRANRRAELGLDEKTSLGRDDLRSVIIEAGYARLRPVLLTAITTILGLIPLATGLNIDFYGLYAHFSPNVYMGGQNADFWGPMAWTVIYGLFVATFLTLIVVPVMYYLIQRMESLAKRV